MQAVTVSFVQTETDLADSLRHATRSRRQGILIHLAALGLAVLLAVMVLPSAKALGPGWILVPAGFGLVLFLSFRYLGPLAGAARVDMYREFNSQHIGETTVRIAPDGLTWSPPGQDIVLQWGVVRRLETSAAGIFITAGTPSTILWIPVRCFPSHEDLQMVADLALRYRAEAPPVPAREVQWPMSAQERKGSLVFAFVWGVPFALAILLLWYLGRTA